MPDEGTILVLMEHWQGSESRWHWAEKRGGEFGEELPSEISGNAVKPHKVSRVNRCKMDWESVQSLMNSRTQVTREQQPAAGVDVSPQPSCVPDDEHEYE